MNEGEIRMETNDMDKTPELNRHNKDEYPPMHTTEHILNQTMIRMFGCGRARSAHIERKKSKCDYSLSGKPSDEEVAEIARRVNEAIDANLPVSIDYLRREEAASIADLSKLPKDASETVRIVRVGDYDACACIGAHVASTGEIAETDGHFSIVSHDWTEGTWRVRFKLAK